MSETFKVEVLFGEVEIQQRPTIVDDRLGYETRKVHRDRHGCIVTVGEWQPPLVWLTFSEPEEKQPAPLWRRLLTSLAK